MNKKSIKVGGLFLKKPLGHFSTYQTDGCRGNLIHFGALARSSNRYVVNKQ